MAAPSLPASGSPTSSAKKASHKKWMMYAAGAGALLLVFLLIKSKSSSSTEEPEATTYTTAPGSIPAGGGGSEGGQGGEALSDLKTFEEELRVNLPTTIQEGINAGLASQKSSTTGSALESQVSSLASSVAALSAGYSGEKGASITYNIASPSAVGLVPTTTEHPATASPAPAAAPTSQVIHNSSGTEVLTTNTQAGNPRAGEQYVETVINGERVHIYTRTGKVIGVGKA